MVNYQYRAEEICHPKLGYGKVRPCLERALGPAIFNDDDVNRHLKFHPYGFVHRT